MSKLIIAPFEENSRYQSNPKDHHGGKFPPKHDCWHHCRQCRNRTARWYADCDIEYLVEHEDRDILIATLCPNEPSIKNEQNTFGRLKKYIRKHYGHGGFRAIMDCSDSGRPHWHTVFVGMTKEQITKAWSYACEGLDNWTDEPRPIKTNIWRTIEYCYKVSGYNKSQPVAIPKPKIKMFHNCNFYHVKTKAEVKQIVRHDQRSIEDKIEEFITRFVPTPPLADFFDPADYY